MFNINKYKGKVFSKNKLLNDKIIALYTLFDSKVDEMKFNSRETIRTLDFWIKIFIDKEEYELADAFKRKKLDYYRSLRVKRMFSPVLFWRYWRRRIGGIFR